MPAKTHGMTETKEYRTWENMKKRCHSIADSHYPRWGGRGISVCDRWRNSFQNFFADMGSAPSPDHQIERNDNDGPYSRENCRWAHKSEQAGNTRKNRLITHNGKTQTMSAWSRETGLDIGAIRSRLELGWPPSEALTIKSDPTNRRNGTRVAYLGRVQTVSAWAREFGVPKLRVFRRLERGMTIKDALDAATPRR